MEGERNKTVTARDKWNVCYDILLKTKFPEDSVLVGYAGDAATLVAARDVEVAQQIDAHHQCFDVGPWSFASAEECRERCLY